MLVGDESDVAGEESSSREEETRSSSQQAPLKNDGSGASTEESILGDTEIVPLSNDESDGSGASTEESILSDTEIVVEDEVDSARGEEAECECIGEAYRTKDSQTLTKDSQTAPINPDSPDRHKAQCAVTAMAEFRSVPSVVKTKNDVLKKDVERVDEKKMAAEGCVGDEAKAKPEEKVEENTLVLSRKLGSLVESIKKIPEDICNDAYETAVSEAEYLLSDKPVEDNAEKSEKKKLLLSPGRLSDIIRRQSRRGETESPRSHPSHKSEESEETALDKVALAIPALPKEPEEVTTEKRSLAIPALPKITRRQTTTEHAHQFEEHSYGAPTYCKICDGLLVGLWSQGFQCKMCRMNVHRGQGLGEHDDCRAEALLTSCPGLDPDVVSPKVKLGEAIKQVHQLAKDSPNFLKDVGEQIDRDIKAIAKEAIVAGSVEEERSRKLRRIKARVVPFVQSVDAMAAHGDVYIFLFLLCIQALAILAVTAISLTAFIVVLWPRHGMLTDTSVRLAAVHDATVTAALTTIGAMLAIVLHRLACVFKRKVKLYDQFLRDAFQIDAEADIGISVEGAAHRAQVWSKHILISSTVSFIVASLLWHAMQPTSWEAATLPPLAGVFVPAVAVFVCAGILALVTYLRAPAELFLTSQITKDDGLFEKTAAPTLTSSPGIGKEVANPSVMPAKESES